MAQRLPIVASDSGTWGTILNGYLGPPLGVDGALWINVKDPAYGALGDGANNDTTAIQNAVNAAYISLDRSNVVYFPPGKYKITTQITVPASSQGIRLIGAGQNVSIIEQNTAGQAIIRLIQNDINVPNHSFELRSLGLQYPSSQSNPASIAILWDWAAPATFGDGHFHHLFEDLHIIYPYTAFSVAKAHGTAAIWDATFRRIWVANVYQSVMDLLAAGLTGQPNIRLYDWYVSNGGVTNAGPMFEFENVNECVMVGMDFENWHGRIVDADGSNIKIVGMHLENLIFDKSANWLFYLTNGSLSVDTFTIGNSATTAACDDKVVMFGGGANARVRVHNGEHNADTTLGAHTVTELVYGATSDNDWIEVVNVKKTGGGLNQPGTGTRAAEVGELLRNGPRALSYGTAIVTGDLSVIPSRIFKVAATNGTAFTINTPTNMMSGERITYDVKNSAGGAMGAVTWGSGGTFLLPGGTFTRPANTKRTTMSFYFDGTNLVADGPQSGDA